LAIEGSEAAGFRRAIADRGNLLQPGVSTARQHDGAIGQLLDRGGAREHADGLLLRSHLAAAAGEIDIAGAQLFIHVQRGDAERDQPVGQQRDPDFTVDASGALDLGDAANALQRRRDDVINEPGHLLGGPRGHRRRVGNDGHPFDVDPLDRRFLDALR